MASSSCREQARVSPSCGLEEKVNLVIGGKGQRFQRLECKKNDIERIFVVECEN